MNKYYYKKRKKKFLNVPTSYCFDKKNINIIFGESMTSIPERKSTSKTKLCMMMYEITSET